MEHLSHSDMCINICRYNAYASIQKVESDKIILDAQNRKFTENTKVCISYGPGIDHAFTALSEQSSVNTCIVDVTQDSNKLYTVSAPFNSTV